MLLVGFLVVRNQPFHDPNLVVLIRTVLSTAVAVLGATIPGFLHIDLAARGVAIRAGGALALFVLTFFFSPGVLPGGGEAPTPPAPPKPPTTLAGFVVDAETGLPLPDVNLSIQDWDGRDGRTPTCLSDRAGRFRFEDLLPGNAPAQQVRLIARKEGYEPSSTDPPLGSTAQPIKLHPRTPRGATP